MRLVWKALKHKKHFLSFINQLLWNNVNDDVLPICVDHCIFKTE